jgi:hypothetical protein
MKVLDKKKQEDIYHFIQTSSGLLDSFKSLPPISEIKAFYVYESGDRIVNTANKHKHDFCYIYIILKEKALIWKADSIKNQMLENLDVDKRYVLQLSIEKIKHDFVIYMCLF